MEEGERVVDKANGKRDSLRDSEGFRDYKRDSLKDPKRDIIVESGRDSPRFSNLSGRDSPKTGSIKDSGRDSPRLASLKESGRDSPRLGLLKDSERNSPGPGRPRGPKRDSLKEANSFREIRKDGPRVGSLKESPRLDNRREQKRYSLRETSGRDSPSLRSLPRNKGADQSKSPADRKRASGKSLDRASENKAHDDEKKSDVEMAETASLTAKRKSLVLERRLLCGCTGVVGLAALVWLTAVCTESWFKVYANNPDGVYINTTARYFLYSTSGLFRICRYARRNDSSPVQRICRLHEMFPPEDQLKAGIWVDKTIINYTRTEMFFSILSLILMVMGFLFSIYTFRNPRYMFKRLAAGIHFLSGSTVMVVIEVLINSIDYERVSLNVVHPKEAYHMYGYSFYLGWAVFVLNITSSITFLIYSKKRKGNKAPNEEIAMADEPTIIGR